MSKVVKGLIDGLEVKVAAESTILQAARALGLSVPTLCHHPGLPGEGGCRLCLVDFSNGHEGKLVTACMYPLRDSGFIIQTNNEAVRSARRFVLELLINRCPASPRLSALASAYGVQPTRRFLEKTESGASLGAAGPEKISATGPESKLCILCGCCARACEINGTSALSLVGRGQGRVAAGPFYQPPVDCVGCLACASVCPMGAIAAEERAGIRRVWGREFTLITCPGCGEKITTREQLDFMGLTDDLCPECRRRKMASAIKYSQRFSSWVG